MGILSSQYVAWLAFKESTYGTDAVEAAINAGDDLVYQVINSDGSITPDDRHDVPTQSRPGEAGIAGRHIPTFGAVNLPMPVRAGVGADFEPENAWAWECAGWKKATSAGVSTTFTLGPKADESASVWMLRRELTSDNWRLKRALGILGNLNIALASPGSELISTLTGNCSNHPEQGTPAAYFDASDQPALDASQGAVVYGGSATAPAGGRIQCFNATLTYNGVDMPLESFDFQQNMGVAVLESALSASETGVRVSRQRGDDASAILNLAFNMSDDGAFFADALAAYQADEIAAIQIRASNATHRLTLDFPAAKLRRPTERPNGESMAWNLEAKIVAPSSTPFGSGACVATFDAAP